MTNKADHLKDSGALYDEHEALAGLWLAALQDELKLDEARELTRADRDDLLQEARIALWEAAASYGAYVLAAGAGQNACQAFADYARQHVRVGVKSFCEGWFVDPDFTLLPDLHDRPYESVFSLWPWAADDDSLSCGLSG